MQVPLTISPGISNCTNQCWNKIISTYSCHYIRNYGLYLVSEHALLWEYVRICNVINYYWWTIRVKSNLLWGLHYWREYVAYTILWNCAENKGSTFGEAFGRLIYCLPTDLNWIWIIPTGSKFLSWKFSCWHPYPIELDFEYPGENM